MPGRSGARRRMHPRPTSLQMPRSIFNQSLLRCALALLLIGLIPPSISRADNGDARLSDIIVTNSQDSLLLYMRVKDAFPERIKNTIESGVPATFSFFVKLYRVRKFWLDKPIVDLVVTHSIKYDNLRKEYLIDRSWDDTTQPLSTPSFEEAKKLMVDIDNLAVGPLDILEKEKRYQIRAKAKLSKLTLPFYLHYVLFFVSLWDFETDWYTVDFVY